MAKSTTQFVCQSCGGSELRWAGRCPQCGAWNSLVETALPVQSSTFGSKPAPPAHAALPEKLSSVDRQRHQRISTGIKDVDSVLGGGIVPGAVMLLSGDPGIGKSTLVLQMAAHLSATRPILYISGEESAAQIKLRADRLGLGAADLSLLCETNADTIAATIESGSYDLVIIDSIQTLATERLSGAAGSIGQITACSQILQEIAKRKHCAMLIIGHVTKDGAIAGPKILEHLVDVVLYIEGERAGNFKVLRGVKNRFGSTSEVGIFEMKEAGLMPVENPSAALLSERQPGPGSVVLAAIEGSRPVLVEVQALVSKSVFGYPKRTSVGIDLNRLNLLVAVLTKRAGLDLNDQDIYVNIVGGLRLTEPAADLAIILSIASAFTSKPIKPGLVTFGEVGLGGEIRKVGQVEKRLAEAKKLGFSGAIGPKQTTPAGKMVGVSDITTAVAQGLA